MFTDRFMINYCRQERDLHPQYSDAWYMWDQRLASYVVKWRKFNTLKAV